MTLKTDRQLRKNNILETIKAFGDITDKYTTLVSHEDEAIYDHISLESDLDKDVSIKFAQSGKEITFSNITLVYDDFSHGGLLQIKHNGDAPTSGSLKIRSW